MVSPARGERGASAAEYLGAVVLVGLLLAAVGTTGLADALTRRISGALCTVAGDDCGEQVAARDAGDGTASDDDVAAAIAAIEAAAGDPAAVADVFEGLDDAVVDRLVAEHAELVGNLDGAPPRVRFEANRTRILAERDAVVADIAAMERQVGESSGLERVLLEHRLEESRERLATLEALGDPARQIILFDASGDGRVAEVHGDLATADEVVYVVPGVGNDLDNFDPGANRDALDLRDEIADLDPDADVVVIAALAYDPPESPASLDAALAGRAEGAADVMPGFVAGVGVHSATADVSVVGHSYGTVAVSLSAQDGMVADDLVLVGSPGVRADHAADLGGAQVHAAEAPDDPIRFVPNETVFGLGHGTSPVDDGFGANVFGTGAVGHAGYLDPGTESLTNIALIVLDRDAEVTRP